MPARHFLAATGLAGLVLWSGAAAAAGPMTFEEVMGGQRRLEEVRFSPDGRRLAMTEQRSDAPTEGLGYPLAQRQVVVADLETGKVARLAGGETGAGTALQFCTPWRPDGAGLAVNTVRDGHMVLGYADLATGKTVTFGPEPATLCGEWVGRRMVYITTDGAVARGWSQKDRLDALSRRWNSAWVGGKPEVTVHSSNPHFAAPANREGGLALADPETGVSTTFALGFFHSLTASPDGTLVAVIRAGEQDALALDKTTGRRGELQVFRVGPLGAELVKALPELDAGLDGLSWSPDSRRLLIAGRAAGEPELGLRVLDLAKGAVSRIPLPSGVSVRQSGAAEIIASLPIGWIGGQPAFIGERQGRLAGAADAARDYSQGRDTGLGLYVATGRGVAPLTAFASQSVTAFAATRAGEGVVVAEGALWAVRPGAAPRRIGPEGFKVLGLADLRPSYGQHRELAVHHGADGDRVAVSALDAQGAPVRVTVELKNGRVLHSASSAGLEALSPDLASTATLRSAGWSNDLAVEGARSAVALSLNPDWRDRPVGETKRFTYQVDGRELDGWVVLPPGYKDGPLPTLVWIYGGQVLGKTPPFGTRPDSGVTPVYNAQLWAARGYAVLYPSTPMGRGADSDVAEALAKDTIAAIDAAAAQGWADPARVGVIGHSFGGFSTAAVLSKRSDRFKAGVAMSGAFDFIAGWGARHSTDSLVDEDGHSFSVETRGYVEGGQIGLETPPWVDLEAYRRASPLYQAKDIKAPLMLMVGDLDLGSTSLGQSERFYAALRRTGNPAVMVRYWGQGHNQDAPPAVRDQWARLTAWFDLYVRDGQGSQGAGR